MDRDDDREGDMDRLARRSLKATIGTMVVACAAALALLAVPLEGSAAPAAASAPASPTPSASPLALIRNNGAPDGAGASVMAVNTGNHTVVATLLEGVETTGLAMAPDGNTAYVGVLDDGGVANGIVPIDMTANPPQPEPVVDLGSACVVPTSVVVVPNGTTALIACFLSDSMVELNLTTSPPTVASSIQAVELGDEESLAVAPNGNTAYVVFSAAGGDAVQQQEDRGHARPPQALTPGSGVLPIDLTTNPPTPGDPVGFGTAAVNMQISPNGNTGYVSDIAESAVYPLNLSTSPITVGTPVTSQLTHPLGLALTPDGNSLYAVNNPVSSATPINVAVNPPQSGTPVGVGVAPLQAAATPDGSQVLVSNQTSSGGKHGTVSFIDTATNTVTATVDAGVLPNEMAIQPDQPPVAHLSVQTGSAGHPTTFDASASTVKFGSITSYHWDFGDGNSDTTSTPTVSHTYAADGTYPASVVETNSAGTSTTQVYTGRDMLRNGGPSASASVAVRVGTSAGYWMTGADGGIFTFGDAGFFGSEGGQPLNKPIVGLAATVDSQGYWLVASDGGIFTFGDAGFFGSEGGQPLNQPIVGMAPTSDGQGYWLVASDGGIFAFGDAGFYGSEGGQPLNKPIVGMAAAPDGKGYWLVASDGGIFTFGDAGFFGSKGGEPLNKPVVGMAATASGAGYWMVASDGGIFAFGDALFHGSKGGQPLNAPIVGMAATSDSAGYWLVASDGGIFAFGDALFHGSKGGQPLNAPMVAMAATSPATPRS
jgi:YVTN family beta-propeller protein